jgi:hypothetical protein
MPELPSARTRLESQTRAVATGVNYCCVIAACALNPDITPRVYTSHLALLEQHGYNPAADYVAIHLEEAKKPIIFVGLPIATAGVVGRVNTSGNSGTSAVSVTAGVDGTLEETDGVATVIKGGVIGVDQIMLGLSLDGGRTIKKVRLGTNNAYTIPYVGAALAFGAGTLVAGDTIATWHTTAPRWDQAGLQAARLALASQQKPARSWLVEGALEDEDDAADVLAQVNAYETAHDRFVYARAQVRDRLPQASLERSQVRMSGNPTLTFAEVGGTGDTITRSAGSWIADGFAVGDTITIAGSASNNVTGPIASLSALVLTLDATDLAAEGPVAGVTVVGTPTLTVAEVGGTGDTITRSRGSWLDDGFRVGDVVTIAGTASNNLTASDGLAAVTATVLTFGATDLAAEVVGAYAVTLTAGETKTQWSSNMDAEFADIDAARRIDLGIGRGRKMSPILGYRLRRPVQWAASVREYQHDVHVAVWQKDHGPLDGWDLEDASGQLVEFDERNDGGGLAARFTCFRTWGNGPAGAFIAMSLTRAEEGDVLSFTHNMSVANVACSVVQAMTENAIGRTLVLDADGTATRESLADLELEVNGELSRQLLRDVAGEGQRASFATWRASPDDVLNTPDATQHGRLELNLRGTIVHMDTVVRVR